MFGCLWTAERENAAVFSDLTALCVDRVIPFVLTPNGASASSIDFCQKSVVMNYKLVALWSNF